MTTSVLFFLLAYDFSAYLYPQEDDAVFLVRRTANRCLGVLLLTIVCSTEVDCFCN